MPAAARFDPPVISYRVGRPAADSMRCARPRRAIPLYAGLRAELARYRALVGHPAWTAPLPAAARAQARARSGLGRPAAAVAAPGGPGRPAADALAPEIYDDVMQQGVRAFQRRHALTAGRCARQGNAGATGRCPRRNGVRQIELAMERLRWTPLLEAPRMIVVNIPEFVLRAYEMHDGKASCGSTMNVIVGKALKTQTPLFDEQMRYIEFSPYWNVPPSIARKESAAAAAARSRHISSSRVLNSSASATQRGADRAVSRVARRGRTRPAADTPAARAPERARRHQVRIPQQQQHLSAPHARARDCSSAIGAT